MNSQSLLHSGSLLLGHRDNRPDEETTMSLYSVETTTAGFSLQKWPLQTIEVGELLARKLSVAAIDNPTYPNPFLVVDSKGKIRCHYVCGKRHAGALAA